MREFMKNTITTTIKTSKSLYQKLLEQVIQDGYGLRGKNRWINESIENFLFLRNFPELVDIADEVEEKSHVVGFRLPETLMRKLEEAVIHVRKVYPAMEGVKSNIIRASLMQRLIRSKLR